MFILFFFSLLAECVMYVFDVFVCVCQHAYAPVTMSSLSCGVYVAAIRTSQTTDDEHCGPVDGINIELYWVWHVDKSNAGSKDNT